MFAISLVIRLFPQKKICNSADLFSSPSRARTYNNSVNSRVLYHWAIEEYLLGFYVPWKPHILLYIHCFLDNTWRSTFLWKFFFALLRRTTFRLGFILPSASPQSYSSSLQVKSPGQTLDRLVLVSSIHYCTSTPSLSTSSSSRGLTSFKEWDISSWGRLHA